MLEAVAHNFLRAWQNFAPGFQQTRMVELQSLPDKDCEHREAETQAAAQMEEAWTEAVADNFLRAWQNLAPAFQQA